MEFELIRPPSWKRFTDLRSRWGKISLTRALQYEELSELCVSGSVVDIGGGEKAPIEVGYVAILITPSTLAKILIQHGL